MPMYAHGRARGRNTILRIWGSGVRILGRANKIKDLVGKPDLSVSDYFDRGNGRGNKLGISARLRLPPPSPPPRNADDPVTKRIVIPIATLALVFYLTVAATASRTV